MLRCSGISTLGVSPHEAPDYDFRVSKTRSTGRETVCKNCKREYNKARLQGTISVTKRVDSLSARFVSALKVSSKEALAILQEKSRVTSEGCWEWTLSTASGGYGGFRITDTAGLTLPKITLIHRWAYWLTTGELDETIHHICANRLCFNPAHLEKISLSQNIGEMLARKSLLQRISHLEEKVKRLELELDLVKDSH
jgi:hypothetical protein